MDVDLDLAICLKYVLDIGDVEMDFDNTDEKGTNMLDPSDTCIYIHLHI